MKVPKYQRQTSITSETGGRMLSVQADANVFSAPGRTAAQAGQQMFKAGLQWYGHELKLKRASELSTNEQAFQAQSAVIKEELNFGNPEKGIAPWDPATRQEEFKRRTIELRNSLSFNIKDKTVKTRFETAAQSRYLTDSLEVMKQTRVDLIDQTHASFIEEEQFLKQELSKYIVGTPGYIDAYNKLFGADEIKKDQWVTVDGALKFVKGQKQSEGLYERMARLGIIDNKEVPTKILKAKNDIANDTVRRRILNSTTEEDFDVLLNELNDPSSHVDLANPDRTTLIRQVQKAKENLYTKLTREITFNQSQEAKKIKEKHKNNFTKYRTQIAAFWRGEGENVLLEDIDTLFGNDDISYTQQQILINAATNNDAIATDNSYFADALKDISEAESDDELDKLLDEYILEVQPNGRLQRTAYTTLESRIQAKRENTQEYQEEVFHRDSLENKVKKAFPTNYSNADTNIRNLSLQNRAVELYNSLLLNPYGPKISAKEAEEIALQEVGNERVAPVPVIKPKVSFNQKIEPKNWSYTHIRQAKEELKNQNLTTEQAERQQGYIREIEEYLDSIYGTEEYKHGLDQEADLPPPPPPPPVTEDDSWINSIIETIGDIKDTVENFGSSNKKDNVIE